MTIPTELQNAIQAEIEKFDWHTILEARKELTDRYRSFKKNHLITKEAHRVAYIAFRMPATYAVVHRILEEAASRIPTNSIKSLLDLGSGPGTVLWAAREIFPDLCEAIALEKDTALASIGQRFGASSEDPCIASAKWQIADFAALPKLPNADLITLSYCMGELAENLILPLIDRCWQAANSLLVIIEPGTPPGFERIRAIRKQLIDLGGHIVAPCPHAFACPMSGGDWCHFSERVERSSLHRRIKEGTLGYEDEKYSYIAVSKTPVPLPESRVLRHPLRRSGHVTLTLCTPEGLKNETISRKEGDKYRQAKKAEWGDPFPSQSPDCVDPSKDQSLNETIAEEFL